MERDKTSIKVEPQLWKQAKIEAIKRGIHVAEFVELAIRRELRK